MPKILWVALPLLLALAGVLAWRLLRRQWPSRLALNVVSSLLLLTYVGTTAALGIFWVANQQLPVFDWHYLFGYATVALLVLHLTFNLRMVWRYLTGKVRPAGIPTPSGLPARPSAARRVWLSLALGGLASGIAYWLGLRQGRSELRIDVSATVTEDLPAARSAAMQLVERFHHVTSHSRTGVLRRAAGSEWGTAPPPFKRYAEAPRLPLPPAQATPRAAALDDGARPDAAMLGTVLWHTAGVTQSRGPLRLRAAPSSGALFSTELYVLARQVDGLGPGMWHYDAEHHALHALDHGPTPPSAMGLPHDAALAAAPVLLVATAVFARTGRKYRDRTYRYVLADLGHALENLHQAAAAVGLAALWAEAFDEARVAARLHLDENREGVLALAGLWPATTRPATSGTWRHPALQPLPLDSNLPAEGLTAAMHRATSLRLDEASTAHPPAEEEPPPSEAPFIRPDTLALIARRRSLRRFAPTPLTLDSLGGLLNGLGLGHPALSASLRLDVVVHAVDGLRPGSYRYEPGTRHLRWRPTAVTGRAASRSAALDQDVVGDAAAVLVLSLDRTQLAADPRSPARAYRQAFLDVGRVGERAYLEAQARGLGACAVGAFYDDEASALVGRDPSREWVVHFMALGVVAG
jgi:SagB-type dehydrogenase family enzyme